MDIKGFKDTIDWYDKNADSYAAAANKIDFSEVIAIFLKKLPPNPRVLDAGCGSGRDSRGLKDGGAIVTGLDISEGLLVVARRDNPDITFVKGNFTDLPLESNSFDGIWAQASLVHLETIEEVQKTLREFYRVLNPGGFIWICVKKSEGDEKTAIVTDKVSNHDRFFRYYDPGELAGLLKDAGFEVGHHKIVDDPCGREEVKWIWFTVQKPKV
jgi:ubiquinone/menaquinone biosynthesis C-methylase UbiE